MPRRLDQAISMRQLSCRLRALAFAASRISKVWPASICTLIGASTATAPVLTEPVASATDERNGSPETVAEAGSASPTTLSAPVDPDVTQLDETTWADLLPRLLSPNVGVNQEARSQLTQSGDPRAIAVMIELLRAAQLRLIRGTPDYYGMSR